MINYVLAIIGIAGGLLCAVADLFLDLKGPNNKKCGKLKVIDSMWETMPHYRFVTSTILAMFAVPMYSCNAFALSNIMSENAPVFSKVFLITALVGAMGGFMIHSFLCACPTIYQTIIKGASFELAEETVNRYFRQIYFPFFTCYFLLVILSSGLVIYAILAGIIAVPVWCVILNPVVIQIVGFLFRATKLDIFIDAPSCCAASIGLASYGVIVLLAL